MGSSLSQGCCYYPQSYYVVITDRVMVLTHGSLFGLTSSEPTHMNSYISYYIHFQLNASLSSIPNNLIDINSTERKDSVIIDPSTW